MSCSNGRHNTSCLYTHQPGELMRGPDLLRSPKCGVTRSSGAVKVKLEDRNHSSWTPHQLGGARGAGDEFTLCSDTRVIQHLLEGCRFAPFFSISSKHVCSCVCALNGCFFSFSFFFSLSPSLVLSFPLLF